jgi:hypothetical protein
MKNSTVPPSLPLSLPCVHGLGTFYLFLVIIHLCKLYVYLYKCFPGNMLLLLLSSQGNEGREEKWSGGGCCWKQFKNIEIAPLITDERI